MSRKEKPFKLDVVSIRLAKDAPLCSRVPIDSPKAAVALVGEHLCQMDREVLCVINLRTNGTPINCTFASIGGLSSSIVEPREIFKASILSNAASMILLHNHPSGTLRPSKEDVSVTDRMIKLCAMMKIPLLDHIIVGGNNSRYFSFLEKGELNTVMPTYETDYHQISFDSSISEDQMTMREAANINYRVNPVKKKTVRMPSVTVDPDVLFHEDEQPDEARRYLEQIAAVKEAWENIFKDPDHVLNALQFKTSDKYPQSIVISPSVRDGVDWQISYFDYTGEAISHRNCLETEHYKKHQQGASLLSLYSELSAYSLDNREVIVTVEYNEKERKIPLTKEREQFIKDIATLDWLNNKDSESSALYRVYKEQFGDEYQIYSKAWDQAEEFEDSTTFAILTAERDRSEKEIAYIETAKEMPFNVEEALEHLYSKINMDAQPDTYYGHTVSVGDEIAVIRHGKINSVWMVEPIGFERLPRSQWELSESKENALKLSMDIRQEWELRRRIRNYAIASGNEAILKEVIRDTRLNEIERTYDIIFKLADRRAEINRGFMESEAAKEMKVKEVKENAMQRVEQNIITRDSEGIRVEGHRGTWYVIDTENVDGQELFLLESEQHGDQAAGVIVDKSGTLILENVWNGFSDYRDEVLDPLSERIIEAMEAAGYSYDDIEGGEGYRHFNGDYGASMTFETWHEAAEWLDGVVFDDPAVSDQVEQIMHPEHFEESGLTHSREESSSLSDLEGNAASPEELRTKGNTLVSVQSAARSNYDNYVVLAQFDRSGIGDSQQIYLGKSENYDNKGTYDNHDNSLIFISVNKKMFSFLDSGEGWTLSQQEMIDNGTFLSSDYAEYASISKRLNGMGLTKHHEKCFGIKVDDDSTDHGVPFRYPDWEKPKKEPVQRQRLFVDMDGTLAVFHPTDTLKPLYEKGYFSNLEPHTNVVAAIKEIIHHHPEIDIFTLSSVLTDSPYALEEKNAWLDKYLPEIDVKHRVFVPCGSDKKLGIEGGVRENDFLLDDYTKNLIDWETAGRGIKLLNALNHSRGTWKKDRLRYDRDPESLANGIVSVMEKGQHIYDERVSLEMSFMENMEQRRERWYDEAQADLQAGNKEQYQVSMARVDEVDRAIAAVKANDSPKTVLETRKNQCERQMKKFTREGISDLAQEWLGRWNEVRRALELLEAEQAKEMATLEKEMTHGAAEKTENSENEFKYYSVTRPIGPGTFPKDGMIRFENYDTRTFVDEINREAWGVLFYNRPLSEAEISSYDLMREPIEGNTERYTFQQLVDILMDNGANLADVAIGRMMDSIEEYTGKWPDWNDVAPQWVVDTALRGGILHKESQAKQENVMNTNKIIPIHEIMDSNGRHLAGDQIIRSAVYNAVKEFQDNNHLPDYLKVIDADGYCEDKEFLYSAYDEFVALSHMEELQPFAERLSSHVESFKAAHSGIKMREEHIVLPLLAEIYYGKQNGLTETQIDFMLSKLDDHAFADTLRSIRYGFEDGLSENEISIFVGEEYYVQEYLRRYLAEGGALDKAKALKGSNMETAFFVLDAYRKNGLSAEKGAAVVQAVNFIRDWNKTNFEEQRARGKKNPDYPFHSFDFEWFSEYFTNLAKDDRVSPEMLSLIASSFVAQRETEVISDFVRNRGGIEAFISKEEKTPSSFIADYYVIEDLQKNGKLDIQRFFDLDSALATYTKLPSDKLKALGITNTNPLPGSLDFIHCKDGTNVIVDDYKKVEGWDNPEIAAAVTKITEAISSAKEVRAMADSHIDGAKTVKTNVGEMPIEDYRHIFAVQHGFDSYEDMYNQGGRIGNGYDKEEAAETRPTSADAENKAQDPLAEVAADESEKNTKEKLVDQLRTGVKTMMNSDQFKNWLDTASHLFYNNYSLNNAILVWLQKPDASYTMGYEQWKDYGRVPTGKGTGIQIFVPVMAYEKNDGAFFGMIKNTLQKQLKDDPNLSLASHKIGMSKLTFTMNRNGMIGIVVDGKECGIHNEAEVKRFINSRILGKVPMYFSTGTVFDAKDTVVPEYLWVKKGFTKDELVRDDNGKSIKNRRGEYKIINTPERQEKFQRSLDLSLEEKDPVKMAALFDVLKAVSERNGIPVYMKDRTEDQTLQGGADGYFSRETSAENPQGYIVMPTDLEPTKMCSVMLHEMGHSDLHGNLAKLEAEMGEKHIGRKMKEVQAEAIAYMTGKRFGVETDTSSFAYIAAYSSGFELQDFQKSIDVIYKECQKLYKEIGAELDVRGLTMDLTEKPKALLEKSSVETLYNKYILMATEQADRLVQLQKELPSLVAENKNYPEALDVVKSQKAVMDCQMAEIKLIQTEAETFKKATTRPEQDACLENIAAAQNRLLRETEKFTELSQSYLTVSAACKGNLKEEWNRHPQKMIDEMKENYPSLKELSKTQIDYITKSRYIDREYVQLLRTNPQAFVETVCFRAEQLDKVVGKNGTFVEVNFCEQWTDKPIVQGGALMHPKVADTIIKQSEVQILGLKASAAQNGEYFPYCKCDVTIYATEENQKNEKHLIAYNTRIDIGDGMQKSLSDHLHQACGKTAAIVEAFDTASRERGAKDKILFNDVPTKEEPVRPMEPEQGEKSFSHDEVGRALSRISEEKGDSAGMNKSKQENEHER